MNHLFLSFLYDLLKVLVIRKDFFDLTKEQRREALPNDLFPEAIEAYLFSVSEEQFQQDLKKILNFLNSRNTASPLKNPRGSLFEAFATFLTDTVAENFDKGLADFPYHGSFGKSLTDFITHNSLQEIADEIDQFLNFISDPPTILFQSAREISPELKTEIRRELRRGHPLSFPSFSTNKDLLGGFRLFINGHIADYTWLSRVHKLSSSI